MATQGSFVSEVVDVFGRRVEFANGAIVPTSDAYVVPIPFPRGKVRVWLSASGRIVDIRPHGTVSDAA